MFLAVLGVYASVYFTKSKAFPFLISGNKVSPVKVRPINISAGLVAGVGTLVAAAFINATTQLTSGIVAAVGLFFACIALLIYDRDSIRDAPINLPHGRGEWKFPRHSSLFAESGPTYRVLRAFSPGSPR
ncbi:hypothetical protein V2K52_23555 [Pseudomonas alliivorans]|nr:hypothetical protein [Pseudomonas alliivorans]MEE4714333.1 hypothetical protein [Pseudomonas alliivorans]MEE4729510.1 hypothetical protein [Pseudomonas alliivorans]MEE4770597.1 hypothetical protein [Pseudomonas alliivorans]MEE4790496.1 hypothetical protein [Pseudomonas alliivorans]